MIPEMTHQDGKYWRQPEDIREAPMDLTHVLLTRRQFDELHEYSVTDPSGVYEGKCWKAERFRKGTRKGEMRLIPTGEWFLKWYGHSNRPGMVSNHRRIIRIGRVSSRTPGP